VTPNGHGTAPSTLDCVAKKYAVPVSDSPPFVLGHLVCNGLLSPDPAIPLLTALALEERRLEKTVSVAFIRKERGRLP